MQKINKEMYRIEYLQFNELKNEVMSEEELFSDDF